MPTNANTRVLMIERPETTACVDFLSEGVAVELSIEGGKLRVVAKLTHGATAAERDDASTWDEHEAEWTLPRGR